MQSSHASSTGEAARPQIRRSFQALVSGLTAFVVIWLLGLAPQFLLYAHAPRALVFFLEGAVSAVAFIAYVRLVEKRSPIELSAWRWKFLLYGAVLGFAMFGILIVLLAIAGHYRLDTIGFPPRLFGAIMFALGTAIWEEVTFRGLLFASIERFAGTWIAIAVSAIVFGVVHGLNPNASLLSSVAIIVESGLLLAIAYVATRTLWFPIGFHFGWNFTEDYLFGVRISGHAAQPAVFSGTLVGTPTFTGGVYGIEASLPAVLLGCVVSSILIWVAYSQHQIVPAQAPKNNGR